MKQQFSLQHLHKYISFCCSETVSWSPGWPPANYEAKANLILLFLLSKCQDSRHVPARMVCAVIRMEPMASCVINTRSISSWAMSVAPTVHFSWPSPHTLLVSLCPFPSCPLPYSLALLFLSRHRLSKALFLPTCFLSWSLSQDFPIPSRICPMHSYVHIHKF